MRKLSGVFTALITPFDAEGNINEEGLQSLIRRQIESGVDGIVPLGSTGEAPTLSSDEQETIIKIAREETPHSTPLMIGTGSYSTAQAIEYTQRAKDLGADMALMICPYYNRPTQEGLFRHFQAVAEAVNIPIVVYNQPGRTGVNLQTETLKRLIDIPTIIGIKEASESISQISEQIEMARVRRPDFSIMSGDDGVCLPLMALGGHGVISVLSNLLPTDVKNLCNAAAAGDFKRASEMHYHLWPLIRAIFIETNPIPIKAAMDMCGLPAGPCRLPLCPLSVDNTSRLQSILTSYCVACR